MKQIFALTHPLARRNAATALQNAPDGYVVRIEEPTRNLDQNAALWPILESFSAQLPWSVNGQETILSAEEWKDILTAAFKQESLRLAMGLNGGVVMLGLRTSKMKKHEFSEFLDFIQSVAAERGIQVYEGEPA